MKLFLIGGTGFIGSIIAPFFIKNGHEVTLLVSSTSNTKFMNGKVAVLTGNSTKPGTWQKNMAEHDCVVNLAGTSIFQRWDKGIKSQIYTSRIATTRNVVEGLKAYNNKTEHLFNASGIGYYGYDQEALFDENSSPGKSFLATVANNWEAEALKAQLLGVRTVLCRFGIVMGRGGGALKNMLPLFNLFCGGTWGSGNQWFSWIHQTDLINALDFLLGHKSIEGPVNFTSPNPVQNRELAECMREVLQRKTIVGAIPGSLIKCLLGEFSEVFLKGQRAIPRKLLENGYTFSYANLKACLIDLIQRGK